MVRSRAVHHQGGDPLWRRLKRSSVVTGSVMRGHCVPRRARGRSDDMLGPHMSDLIITSPSNPRLKNLIALRRRRSREESGPDADRGLRGAVAGPRGRGAPPRRLLLPGAHARTRGRSSTSCPASAAHGAWTPSSSAAAPFEKVAYREGPDGFLAVVESVTRTCADLESRPRRARPAVPGRREARGTSAPCCAPLTPPVSRRWSRRTR